MGWNSWCIVGWSPLVINQLNTTKSSVSSWDFPSKTIHFWIAPFMETPIIIHYRPLFTIINHRLTIINHILTIINHMLAGCSKASLDWSPGLEGPADWSAPWDAGCQVTAGDLVVITKEGVVRDVHSPIHIISHRKSTNINEHHKVIISCHNQRASVNITVNTS